MNGSLMNILAVITDIPVEYHKHTHTQSDSHHFSRMPLLHHSAALHLIFLPFPSLSASVAFLEHKNQLSLCTSLRGVWM